MKEQKKVGRPKVNDPKATRLGIRLDEKSLKTLAEYCQKKGLSKSEVIRQALNEFIK
jgi:Ribbon-helix-helix protein, copG family.